MNIDLLISIIKTAAISSHLFFTTISLTDLYSHCPKSIIFDWLPFRMLLILSLSFPFALPFISSDWTIFCWISSMCDTWKEYPTFQDIDRYKLTELFPNTAHIFEAHSLFYQTFLAFHTLLLFLTPTLYIIHCILCISSHFFR